MISRETERFVNELHTHEAEVRSSNELLEKLQDSKEGMSYYEKKEVTTSPKETWTASSIEETRAGSLTLVPNMAFLYTRRVVPRNEKKWISISANPKRGIDLAMFISKTVTTMSRHFDQDERESDGSRHCEATKSELLRKFADSRRKGER